MVREKRKKRGLGICQVRKSMSYYIKTVFFNSHLVLWLLTQAPQSVNGPTSSNLPKSNNTDLVIYIKQDNYIIIVPHNTIALPE